MSGFEEARDDAPWDSAPGTAASDWELAAASVGLAMLARGGVPLDPLPAALADRIRGEAAAHVRPGFTIGRRSTDETTRGRPAGRPWLAAAGWWTAACLAGLLVWQWGGRQRIAFEPGGVSQKPSLSERRKQLLDDDHGALTVAWKKAGDDPAIVSRQPDADVDGSFGDVVWSPTRQQGYMRFRGLAANDPAVSQYQLWIFDAARNDAYPVDGGVFDVPAEADGDVVVRIDPRLAISRATAFAITVEKPGGVVVSSRERLPLLAAVP